MAHPMLNTLPRMTRARRGFTLVELMIVVAIVGVLAALGVYGLRRYQQYAGTGEATGMLQGMRGAQENFKSENLTYGGCTAAGFVNAGANVVGADFFPRALATLTAAGDRKMAFSHAADDAHQRCFRAIGFRSDGPVKFTYASIAGQPGTALPANPAAIFTRPIDLTGIAGAPREPWYVLIAAADRDGDGTLARLHATSLSNEVYMEQETE